MGPQLLPWLGGRGPASWPGRAVALVSPLAGREGACRREPSPVQRPGPSIGDGGGGGKNGARCVFVIISEAGAGGRMFALWFEFLPGQGAGRWSRGGRG